VALVGVAAGLFVWFDRSNLFPSSEEQAAYETGRVFGVPAANGSGGPTDIAINRACEVAWRLDQKNAPSGWTYDVWFPNCVRGVRDGAAGRPDIYAQQ
jgi:hypothetical protein